jgi:hypothetical protein
LWSTSDSSSILDMPVMERIAEYNRKVTNPLMRPWADWAPTLAAVEHVGRRSGNRYRTPVMVFDL